MPESPLGMASVGIVLALLLGTALVEFNFTPFTLRLSGIFGGAPPSTAFADTGAIVFTPAYGNDCRRILFSNRTGWIGPDQQVPCDFRLATGSVAGGTLDVTPNQRMMSIREAFSSHPTR